ncbi:MAG: hypothetical protein V1709_06570 [Planctomycetota bacterium]
MDDSEKIFSEFQNVALYKVESKKIKHGAVFSIIWGLLNLFLAIIFLKHSSLNIILVLISLALLTEGIWLLIRLAPWALLADGIFLCAIGVWNIIISILNVGSNPESYVTFFILAVIQIGFGIASFQRYKSFSVLWLRIQSDAGFKQINEIIDGIVKTEPEKTTDFIRFKNRGLFSKEWKGKLFDLIAIFLPYKEMKVICARKEDINVEPKGKIFLSKSLKVSIKIGKDKFNNCAITPEYLKRYEDWKSKIPPVVDASEKEKQVQMGV